MEIIIKGKRSDFLQSRSVKSIMKVVREQAPRLESIYSQYLSQSKFHGKVMIRFTINPKGKVIKSVVVADKTGHMYFAVDVLREVSSWIFVEIESGNTTVTIPFTFFE